MKCFYCPQKGASVVPWDSLSPDAPGYEQREERHKVKEKEAKERTDKKRKHECVTQKWDKDRDKKYKEEVVELQRTPRALSPRTSTGPSRSSRSRA